VVERGIAVSAIILRSVVRPSVAASFLADVQLNKETVRSLFLFWQPKKERQPQQSRPP
jgi:hypothetical protein